MTTPPNIEVGQVFGRLQVIAPPVFRKRFGRFVLTRCFCPAETVREVRAASLFSGIVTGCGCVRKERAAASNTKHGGLGTDAYKSWQKMRQRCTDPSGVAYHRYGGRGITVCDRWNDFANFYADMGDRPPGMTLDRINSDGNYEPGNCRWATRQEQSRNRSGTRLSVEAVREMHRRHKTGESQMSLSRAFGVSYGAVWHALHRLTWADAAEAH